MVICYLKLAVEIFLEIDALFITATYDVTYDAIFDYIAIECVSELDEIYYQYVKSNLKDELEDRNYVIPIKNFENINMKNELPLIDRIFLYIHEVVYQVYEMVYFHFTPYIIFIAIPLWKRTPDYMTGKY